MDDSLATSHLALTLSTVKQSSAGRKHTLILRPFALLFLIFFTSTGFAQDRGNITGTITDPGGAAIPGAAVKIANPATGLQQTTSTGSDGSSRVE
ncbi:MAG: carboxypeptidase-like regulatory domain-containing protein [Bryobacteraceae bacterium]